MPSMKSVALRAAAFVLGHVVLLGAVVWFGWSVSQADGRAVADSAPAAVETTGSIAR